MGKYVLAIDQGTTGTTALILDQRLSVKAKANVEFVWEHDLEGLKPCLEPR